ncbi:MAG: hypothetical protein US83_C0010G0014 [Candidatus Falkowbacteria bacterium GW2011_GWC2_38_22]|uniref:Uncharacterized protein n=1 Tax=Candidatus Falkowbacteria bacterium GW2011_GWE1_38_31 TaxID=1618638 RepID=A0A0G0K490_9BACT|nr:MAG: hypothetical protein US73_C0005G0014 [Candidatus Falkowbacteria bacterium GW2011_GWF2_38_1205]KKQ60980.1 MAG: hypothetical protein US83_C0010G0014 [Candidatus Falkowbacteria bacterium GW2011_GWC2_38_22]KKQ63491.1 MAG: hypothetical protein US84_C0006G0094 [Candidatus Falkowbacteria bacterium GW2011_GWF1_38_22]KKQ65438.1 MAG: hypothetical protein US87_C0007G0014 [Candidatus Falkowbacteria bacterium GW2011_GWE2_38_254]KKQ70255.1 MAG: hypothetical protein US91_C0006G0094 [Candidatus Falkowb
MGNLFTLKMWFNMQPGILTRGAMISIIGLLVVLFAATVFFVLLKNKKRNLYNRIWQKLYFFSISNFIIGLILFFFAYELLPFLSMRFWFLLWWIGMAIWLGFILRIVKEIPKIKEQRIKEDEFKKYIP